MITASQLTSIGQLHKPHGIKGEIAATLDDGIDPDALRCIVLDIDGIYVPFFIGSLRAKGSGLLLKLDGIDDENAAAELANHEIFGLTDEVGDGDEPDGMYLSDLTGWNFVADGSDMPGAVIADIDDSTDNILIVVDTADGRRVLVPYVEDWITELDPDTRTLHMSVPDGIIDLND